MEQINLISKTNVYKLDLNKCPDISSFKNKFEIDLRMFTDESIRIMINFINNNISFFLLKSTIFRSKSIFPGPASYPIVIRLSVKNNAHIARYLLAN